jgi:hypothetical protein
MQIRPSGDVDRAFVAQMSAHHQGATPERIGAVVQVQILQEQFH